MAELDNDPRCNFCHHRASLHRARITPDASVPCLACEGGRCPPQQHNVADIDPERLREAFPFRGVTMEEFSDGVKVNMERLRESGALGSITPPED